MATDLLTTGLACIIVAVVGGGLKAFGIELPALTSRSRQVLLGTLGVGLAGSGLWLGRAAAAADAGLTLSTWTLIKAVDDSGKDWSNSTLKFTSESREGDKFRVAGYFEWRAGNVFVGKEEVEGRYDPVLREIILEGKRVNQEGGYRQARLALGSYSAHLSPDGLSLTEGSWGTDGGVEDQNARAEWEALR